MKVSELKPYTIFKELGTVTGIDRLWLVRDDGKVSELQYHCVDCIEEYVIATLTPEGNPWVDERFGQNFLILNIPTEQLALEVSYVHPTRIVIRNGNQVMTGVSYKTKYEEVLEFWPDDATSYIHINTNEWQVSIGDFWRIIPEFPKYEMTRDGEVRNGETGQVLHPYPRGKILTISLGRTTRSLTKLYHQVYPEQPRMEFIA